MRSLKKKEKFKRKKEDEMDFIIAVVGMIASLWGCVLTKKRKRIAALLIIIGVFLIVAAGIMNCQGGLK